MTESSEYAQAVERWVRCEYVGGPKDGQVEHRRHPPPQEWNIPLRTRAFASAEPVPPRVGVYRARVEQNFEVVTIGDEIPRGDEMHEVIAQATRMTFLYDWEGDR